MKKVILILTLVLGTGLSFGQIGIDLGVNNTKITGKNSHGNEYNGKISPIVNVFYAFEGKHSLVKAGVGYSQIRSSVLSYWITDISGNPLYQVSETFNYNYLNIPISGYYLPFNDKFIAGVGAGINGKIKLSSNANSPKSFVMDVMPSAIVGYKFNKISVMANFNYGIGLIDLNERGNGYNYFGGFITLKYSWQ